MTELRRRRLYQDSIQWRIAILASAWVRNVLRLTSSFFNVAKNDSDGALSQAHPGSSYGLGNPMLGAEGAVFA